MPTKGLLKYQDLVYGAQEIENKELNDEAISKLLNF